MPVEGPRSSGEKGPLTAAPVTAGATLSVPVTNGQGKALVP